MERTLQVPGSIATEALRAILTHEKIEYRTVVGTKGETTIINQSDYHRAKEAVHQWQQAVTWIYNAI